MKDILISVVLPIYNTEKYLHQCIESVVNQTYKNLEIILVDDESPDNSPQICEEWAKKDSRIKVIHKKNEGLGMARNTGLENATGDYIVFFDSDDYVDVDLFSDMVDTIKQYGESDLIEFGHRRVNNEGKVLFEMVPDMPEKRYSGKEVTEVFLPELMGANPYTGKRYGILMSAWCCAYKVETLKKHDFRFESEREIISEDVYSLLKLISDIDCVLIMDKAYYNYRHNENSLTNVYKKDRFEKIVDFYDKTKQLIREKDYVSEVELRLMGTFLSFVLACLKIEVEWIKTNGIFNTYKKVKQILNNVEFNDVLKIYPIVKNNKSKRLIYLFMKKKYTTIVMLLIICKQKVRK